MPVTTSFPGVYSTEGFADRSRRGLGSTAPFDATGDADACCSSTRRARCFDKRSEVLDSHHRYASLGVGYLLQIDGGVPRGGHSHHEQPQCTAFHEIAHTFMPGFAVVPQYRCDPRFPGDQEPSSKPAVEELCDLGAAEMLLPRGEFLADMAGSAPTIGLASRLATRYEASLEAAARRVVDLHDRPAMLIVLEVARKPSAPREQPRLRVQLVHAKGSWPFIPRHKSVPEGSPLAMPLAGEPVTQTCTLAGIADVPLQDVHVSAVFAPYTDHTGAEHARVVAMISRPGGGGRGHAA